MARILGGIASGLTIAALFRTSFEVFDIVQSSRNQEPDYKKLKLRLDIEKCRMYAWGQSVGITDVMEAGRDRPIDNLRFPEAVQSILTDLIQLFDRAETIKNKYEFGEVTTRELALDNHRHDAVNDINSPSITSTTTPVYISPATQVRRNITWVVNDRHKFTMVIAEIKDMIDRLKEITTFSGSKISQAGTAKQGKKDTNKEETPRLTTRLDSNDQMYIARLRQRQTIDSSWAQSADDVWLPGPRLSRYGNPRL